MTYVDVMEAIAAELAALWPERMLYRDYCPADFHRPSGFLYVTEAEFTDAALGLVEWTLEAELELRAATDAYSTESTEALREDQAAVLTRFGGPSLAVGDRHIVLDLSAPSPGPGTAYVRFSASWMDQRPGWHDPEDPDDPVSAGVPRMEDYQLTVTTKE